MSLFSDFEHPAKTVTAVIRTTGPAQSREKRGNGFINWKTVRTHRGKVARQNAIVGVASYRQSSSDALDRANPR